MKIAFAGGGTLGPVTPLLAVARRIKEQNDPVELVWFGTPDGPERQVVEREGFCFVSIPVAKLPRHLDVRLFTFPFDMMKARREARVALQSIKPDLVVTAGGFTGVPVVKEAAKLGIPCVMHQLDVVPGLSNKAIAKLCASVTTSFPYEQSPFGSIVSTRIATPVRFESTDLPSKAEGANYFHLDDARPIVFIVGGGTGAKALNEAIDEQFEAWNGFAQLIHVTGKGKLGARVDQDGYAVREFLDAEGIRHAYAAADLVVTRAGIGGLSELAALSKAAIIVPIPGNQQEENAKAFHRAKAGLYAKQDQEDFADMIVKLAKHLLSDRAELMRMGDAAHAFFTTDDGSELADRAVSIMK
jgi:UDP-N-acetylglucosamine--N-acetylmuramyl-(pentapeptide) pyrophosphoryl-undecaprenol N-acetylglucosamine transferase